MDRLLKGLGQVVRELRREHGLSQEALAEAAQMHRTYLGGIERGERNPTYVNLQKLAVALGVPASTLFARAEAKGKR